MFQSLVWEVYTPKELLTKDVPPDRVDDLDYMVSLLDWDLNVDPYFYENRFMLPKPVKPLDEMAADERQLLFLITTIRIPVFSGGA